MTMNIVLPEEAVNNDTAKALTAFIVDLVMALFIDSGNPALILVTLTCILLAFWRIIILSP